MNPHAIPALVAVAINLCLGAYVLSKDPKKELNIVFAVMLFSFAWFSFAGFMEMSSPDSGTAVFWVRRGAGSIMPFIYAFTLHLVSVFPKSLLFFGKKKQALALLYTLAIVFSLLAQSDLVFQGAREYPWGFQATAGPLFLFPYLAFALLVLVWVLFLLVRAHVHETGVIRKQVDCILAGGCTIAVMSTVGDTLPLLLGEYFMPSLTTYSLMISGILIAYAILKYKLFILPPIARFFVPAPEAYLPTKPKYKLEEGRGYLIKEKEPDRSAKLFMDQTTHGISGLWITSLHPKKAERHGLRRTSVLSLTYEQFPGEVTLPPTKLDRARALVSNQLVRTRGRSVVMVDCFKELVVANGFKRVLGFIQELGKICSENASNLIVRVDSAAFSKRQLAEIERALRERERERKEEVGMGAGEVGSHDYLGNLSRAPLKGVRG